MLTRKSRRTTTRFRENNGLKLFGLMLRQFERLGPQAEVDQHLALVRSSIDTDERVSCGTGYDFFSAVHAATEHQFEM
jgi:hypothetical protein